MARLISTKERIPVTIDDIVIYISPLSYQEKMQLQDHMLQAVNGNMSEAMKGAAMSIKFAVKKVDGIETSEGYKYQLEFEENGKYITDSCVDDLLNLPQNNKLIATCSSLLEGIPAENIRNPSTGEPLEGVVVGDVPGKQKKNKESGS